ncbi:Hypothetical_protein [Hexamita inflata]|uniref:Hypothetical_protein n=1 Tax=Hexamita inflata TaxID=28002 RepID=A0AA86P633_9EUKA|nr:Hypothetical protein HINF_LOCUS18774 [Hexamita inflata]
MIIMTKATSQITTSSTLNVLTSSSSNSNIKNLCVNLSFAASSGIITLISSITGIMQISNYQVLGKYQSTQAIAMIGITVNSISMDINKIQFKPSLYYVGNCSSYLFSNVVSNLFTFFQNNIAIILGNCDSYQTFGSTSSSSSNIYQFGGIISNLGINSKITIINYLADCYKTFSTKYVSKSGIIIGQIESNTSNIMISNLCIQLQISSTTIYNMFGLLGSCYGNSSLQQVSIIISVKGSQFQSFGLIGQQSNSNYSEIVNLYASVTVQQDIISSLVSVIFGLMQSSYCSIQNVSVVNSNLIAQYFVGGYIGVCASYTTIYNSFISQTSLSGENNIGGYFGYFPSSAFTVKIHYSKLDQIRISGSHDIDIVFGGIAGVPIFVGSYSSQIYVNDVLQSDCPNLTSC